MNATVSARYRNATIHWMTTAGEWTGPATLDALAPRMAELHALGLTSRAAAAVLAREYRLHSRLQSALDKVTGA